MKRNAAVGLFTKPSNLKMNIIVCIKQVTHIYVQWGIDPETNTIDPEGLVYIVNPYDEIAVEEAIRIKEKLNGGEVTLITLGPSRAEMALRLCMAMGADKAIHIFEEAFEDLDPWVTSLALSKVISDLEYDLILFGKQAIDDGMGQVGAYVAESLSLPIVSAVTKLDFSPAGKKTTVQRALEKGDREVVKCPLPAVFTVERSLNKPRYPTFPARKAALTKVIQRTSLKSLGLSWDKGLEGTMIKLIGFSPPKLRPKKILVPDSNLPVHERLDFIMSGGIVDKGSELLEGDPKEIASKVVDLLVQQKIV